MNINNRELATVLAALRHWQDTVPYNDRDAMPHFDEETYPLDDYEINVLCEEINTEVDVDDT